MIVDCYFTHSLFHFQFSIPLFFITTFSHRTAPLIKKIYLGKVRPKTGSRLLFRTRWPFCGPLAAFFNFAGGVEFKAVNECPLRCLAGIFQYCWEFSNIVKHCIILLNLQTGLRSIGCVDWINRYFPTQDDNCVPPPDPIMVRIAIEHIFTKYCLDSMPCSQER